MIGYPVEVAVKAETLMSSPSETAAANSVGLMFQGAMRSIPPDHSPGSKDGPALSVDESASRSVGPGFLGRQSACAKKRETKRRLAH